MSNIPKNSIKKRKVVSDSIVLAIVEVVIRLKGLIFLPIILATIGLREYGVFVQIIVNQALIVAFSSLALGMAFFRYTSKLEDSDVISLSRDFWTVMSISTLSSIIGALIIYFISPIISEKILQGLGLKALQYSSILVVIGVFGEQLSRYIQSRRLFKLFSIYNVLYQLGPYLGLSIGLLSSHDLVIGLIGYIVIQGIVVLTLFVYVVVGIRFQAPSLTRLIKFVKYSWGLMFTFISDGLLSKVNRYFIGYFIGPSAIGIYNIIYAVASFLDMFTVPFRKYYDVYLPMEWDLGFINKVKQQLKEGLLYYLTISIGAIAGFTFYLKTIIYYLLHKDISYIANFNLLIFTTSVGILCLGISRFYDPIIKYRELNHFKLILQLLAVLINTALNYLFIPKLALLGAALGTLISYSFVLLVQASLFRLHLNKGFYIKTLGMIIATIPIYIIYSTVKIQNAFGLFLSVTSAAIIFIILLLILRIIRIERIKSFFA